MTGTHRFPLALLAALLAALVLAPANAFADEPVATTAAAPAKVEAPATPRTPMLWEVDTKPKIYLFGTIHVGDPRVLAHPPVVKKALEASQALYTEIDMDPKAMMALAPLMRLPAGQSLKTILPGELHGRMQSLFKTKGLSQAVLDAFDNLHVWAIYLQLQTLDVDPKTRGQALDQVLAADAKKAGKHTDALEQLNEQIDIFATLTTKEQVRMLEESVAAIEKARKDKVSPLAQLIELYLKGDADLLFRAMMKDMDKGDALSQKLMKRMLDDRNVRMVERMLRKTQAQPGKTAFVAVGTAHYPGKMGIIELLRRTGFRVRKLNSVADMAKPWPLVMPSTSSREAPRRKRIRIGPFCLPDPCSPPPCCPK